LQDEVAGTVAQALKAALRSDAPRQESERVNVDAYNLVLKGNYFANRGSDPDIEKATDFYKEAIRLDPNYALAWAKLGAMADVDTPKGRAEADAALERALRIDPNLASAYWALESISVYSDFNWSKGRAELERAIELDPNNSHYRAELAWLNEGMFGAFDNKIRYLRQAVSNDPLDAPSQWHLALTLLLAGRFDESATAYRKLLELSPDYVAAQADYAVDLVLMRRYAEALAAAEKEPREAQKLWSLAIVHWGLGQRSDSDTELSRAKERYAPHEISAYRIAIAHAFRGQGDAAFEWLDRAYQKHEGHMALFAVDPRLGGLRTDARYKALLTKMRLDSGGPQLSH
jgi:serine/threonine-protein kinase